MPVFTNAIKMNDDFMDGVIETTNNGNWEYFTNFYGTHYTYQVTFGGRYVYSHSYTAQSMSYFKSKGLDISIAAKVQFANFFSISMSDDLKRYQNQTNVINT